MSCRLQWTLPLMLLTLLTLAVISACDDNDSICRPTVPAGTIKGTVRAGGLPFEAIITANQINSDMPSGTGFEDSVTVDGAYELDLPAGDYVIGLRFRSTGRTYYWSRTGPSLSSHSIDTLRINSTNAPQVADFDLGSVVFRAEVPDVLEGRHFSVVLHPRDDLDFPLTNGSEISAGTLVADGWVQVSMPGVLLGEYQVELQFGYLQYMMESPYDGEHIWLPGTRDREASPWYEVNVDEPVELTCEFPTTWATLEGSVTGAWLEMGLMTGPEISLVTTDSTVVIGRRRLIDGADLSVDVVWPQPVKVMVTSNGIQQWIGGSSFDQATVFDLGPGQTTQGADLVQSGLILDLAMVDFRVTSMVFQFHDPTDYSVIGTSMFQYGFDRFIGIPNLAPGDYILKVEPYHWDRGSSAWRPQWFDRATSAAEAQIISIGDGGAITTHDLVLEVGGEIHGSVQHDSEPAMSYFVLVTSAVDEVVWFYNYDWAIRPGFAVSGLPDGPFKIGVCAIDIGWSHSGPAPEGTVWYPGTTDWNAASILEIEDAAVLEDIVFVMP